PTTEHGSNRDTHIVGRDHPTSKNGVRFTFPSFMPSAPDDPSGDHPMHWVVWPQPLRERRVELKLTPFSLLDPVFGIFPDSIARNPALFETTGSTIGHFICVLQRLS